MTVPKCTHDVPERQPSGGQTLARVWKWFRRFAGPASFVWRLKDFWDG